MIAKVFVLAFVALAACENHGYTLKALHLEPAQGYRHYYEHAPKVHEEQDSSHETRYSAAPESHGPAYASQSIIHHAPHIAQEASQESNDEHVAPVYQYVQEEEETPAPHPIPAKHYQSIQYPSSAPVHHERVPVHVPQAHAAIRVVKPHVTAHAYHAQPHYAHGQEETSYHNGAQQHEAPVHHALHAEAHAHESHDEPIDYYAYPKYQYEYRVEDPHTGDNKFQHEYRDGDVVKGVYSLQEADGSIRTVEYSSDKHTGFSAVVKHSAPGHHVQVESHHQH